MRWERDSAREPSQCSRSGTGEGAQAAPTLGCLKPAGLGPHNGLEEAGMPPCWRGRGTGRPSQVSLVPAWSWWSPLSLLREQATPEECPSLRLSLPPAPGTRGGGRGRGGVPASPQAERSPGPALPAPGKPHRSPMATLKLPTDQTSPVPGHITLSAQTLSSRGEDMGQGA